MNGAKDESFIFSGIPKRIIFYNNFTHINFYLKIKNKT